MKNKLFALIIVSLLLIIATPAYMEASSLKPIKIVLDGVETTPNFPPVIENGRTLVPLRFISEELGADVQWINETRTVVVSKDGRSVLLKIGSNLIQYNDGNSYGISDVTPKIIVGTSSTFIPIRLIGNALGVQVEWDNDNRAVIINSKSYSDIVPFYSMKITSLKNGHKITGRTNITLEIGSEYLNKGDDIRLLLIDKDTHTGFIVGRTKGNVDQLYYVPSVEEKGDKVLVAAVYDVNNNLIAADAIPVIVDTTPIVRINGITDFDEYQDLVKVTPSLNFNAHSVKYIFTNKTNGRVFEYDKEDPYLTKTFSPAFENKGTYTLQVVAYDQSFNEYKSNIVNFVISSQQRISLLGVKAGSTISSPVNLSAGRNFNVNETKFIMIDSKTRKEEILEIIPYGTFSWFPKPEQSGEKELVVEVKDTKNLIHRSNPIKVIVDGKPKIQLLGVGPDQVITSSTKLEFRTNVVFDSVSFNLTHSSGKTKIIRVIDGEKSGTFTPVAGEEGNWTIYVTGLYGGSRINSESVQFRVYLGKLYGPTIIVPKDQFKDFASNMARDSFLKTGMSAAIQTSQAILETGWGQSVPTDKYTGKFSRNLFGIKGTGSNGYVISNTWEVYNGVTYRIDDKFRAYNDPKESWDDHKALLLNATRYEIFRDVMFDTTMGPWAIRRAGYATDPSYPLKLMDIIQRYNLKELDRIKL